MSSYKTRERTFNLYRLYHLLKNHFWYFNFVSNFNHFRTYTLPIKKRKIQIGSNKRHKPLHHILGSFTEKFTAYILSFCLQNSHSCSVGLPVLLQLMKFKLTKKTTTSQLTRQSMLKELDKIKAGWVTTNKWQITNIPCTLQVFIAIKWMCSRFVQMFINYIINVGGRDT